MERSFLILVVTLLVGVAAMARSSPAVEEPGYQVSASEGAFEIRLYAPMVVAETAVVGDWSSAGNAGFRRLAGYIFGGNDGGRKIAMTAPVAQTAGSGTRIPMTAPVSQERRGESWVVAFTMPAASSLESLPRPDDARVTLRTIAERRIGAVRFSGTWSPDRFAAKTEELRRWLEARGERLIGEPVIARYDPPWTPWFLRRNEVLFELASPVRATPPLTGTGS